MENIEITVKVNGTVTPLHQISEQTLLKIRESSKPKEIPVARTANYLGEPEERRLILKVPVNISSYEDKVVAIDLKSGKVVGYQSANSNEARDVQFYDNIQVIS